MYLLKGKSHKNSLALPTVYRDWDTDVKATMKPTFRVGHMALSRRSQAKMVGNSSLHPFTLILEVSKEPGLLGRVPKLMKNIEFFSLGVRECDVSSK